MNQKLVGTTFQTELPPVDRTFQIGGSHYTDMEIQPWDAMSAWRSDDEFFGFLRGNANKDLARVGTKANCSVREDLLKAKHYLERLLEEIG